MENFKTFCNKAVERERLLQKYTQKGSLFGEPFVDVMVKIKLSLL